MFKHKMVMPRENLQAGDMVIYRRKGDLTMIAKFVMHDDVDDRWGFIDLGDGDVIRAKLSDLEYYTGDCRYSDEHGIYVPVIGNRALFITDTREKDLKDFIKNNRVEITTHERAPKEKSSGNLKATVEFYKEQEAKQKIRELEERERLATDSSKLRGVDNVNHPPHYTQGDIEAIDIIEQIVTPYYARTAYHLGNVIKYIIRAPFNNRLEDLKKARWYLNRAIETWEEND